MEHNHPVTLWYDLVVVLHMLTASLSLSHSLSLSLSAFLALSLFVRCHRLCVWVCVYIHI